jgi:protein-L-isoaspartate(D-aspartate) O-methyltransferase
MRIKGSGYTCAVFYRLAEGSKVVGIDHIPELVEFSVENLKNDGLGSQIESGDITMITGDGRKG